jgi:hypothetical protein
MKQQLEQLKTELREFIELSKKITPGEWIKINTADVFVNSIEAGEGAAGTHVCDCDPQQDKAITLCAFDAAFIAQSRNISPSMAECLLVVIEWLDLYAIPTSVTDKQLQQILTIWEASK